MTYLIKLSDQRDINTEYISNPKRIKVYNVI